MSHNVKDRLPSDPAELNLNVKGIVTTDDLIELIRSGRLPKLYLTAHPERWSHNTAFWLMDEVGDAIKNAAKSILRRINLR
jgi:hypothetical protein